MSTIEEQIEQIETAISAQETLRPTLGDAVVETTIAALRARLDGIRAATSEAAPPVQATPSADEVALLHAYLPMELATKMRRTGRIESERRRVTVLFADLVGSTALGEGRDPEEVAALMQAAMRELAEAAYEFEGYVDKFVGDGIMVVFGAPITHEDDAERAVRAGLELILAVQELAAEVDSTNLKLRAGVTSGEAAVTIGATGQGMVAGDMVNTASRLQSAAPPGSLLVDESTMRAASVAITFEPAGDKVLKGKELPIAAWRADRVVAMRGGANRSEALEPPFVGREAEMRILKELLHATGRERRARLVSFVGVAGIGKSRLAWEFRKYIDGLVEDVYWHQGRSPAYGEGITFWALGEMVRKRAGLAESDDASTTRERIAATVAEYVPDAEERRWVEPRLLQLLGVEEGRSGEREELFAAWRTFFERVADLGPTILLFEDLQWADPGLLDFIDHVLEWSRAHPILIVTMARPDLLDRRPDWGAGRRNSVSLSHEPLATR
jgi:class 3 adenylate cyclase